MTDSLTARAAAPPVIGISAYAEPAQWAGWHEHATLVPHAYVDRVAAAGCVPVVLPPVPGVEQVAGRLDGLLLTGGGDVDPGLHATRRHPRTARVYPERDAAELALLRAAFGAGLPVLGICRGLQVLNVVRGGTLVQHLPEHVGHDGHAPGPTAYGTRAVKAAPGSRVAEILGRDALSVPCHHHQAVERLGAGLTATAWSDDGVIEAVELDGHPFVIAVQWHPEVSEDRNLFRALADAARARSWRSSGLPV
ncbi:MAG TPA: gamma-glutamyl-gamma-aminobutyrate hydrolase family protein [Streptosporangiaceae bacterium]|nr:gamma-glutamyl-gamma-aminobutyrate hydrolase family protein [Streptosporangiaceae bacterium]